MIKRAFGSAVVVLVLCLGPACGDGGDGGTGEASETPSPTIDLVRSPTELELPITVAVTLPLFGDFAREIGRENVRVISLVPGGADPHTYELTAADIERLKGVDFFFVNGLGLDKQITDVIEANRDDDAHVIPFAPNVRSPQGPAQGNPELTAEEAGDNAHLWLDPLLAYIYAEIIADEFDIYDGVRQSFYDANFSVYQQQIFSLKGEIRAQIEAIPPSKRKLVTYHDSFSHFARQFGLEATDHLVADTSEAPSAADVDRVARKVRDEGVPAIFAEYGYEREPMATIATAAGVPICTLYSDITSESITTYVEMMRANAKELVRCLGGGG